jgi:hypothetical protein
MSPTQAAVPAYCLYPRRQPLRAEAAGAVFFSVESHSYLFSHGVYRIFVPRDTYVVQLWEEVVPP